MTNPHHTLPADSLILCRECEYSKPESPCHISRTVNELCEFKGNALECDKGHPNTYMPELVKGCFDQLVFRLLLREIVGTGRWNILPDS